MRQIVSQMLSDKTISYYGRMLLIVAEVILISFLGYALVHYLPGEMGRYISVDVLYCLPIIQTARLAATHRLVRHSDTQVSAVVAVVVALAWSGTEAAIIWPDFPLNAFVLNAFTRSVIFTVLGRVMLTLWHKSEYAHRDMLTGLANRVELLERLEAEQVRSERSGRPYSLVYIDIDQFKSLNDSHGHHVGDEALKMLADILRAISRKSDTAARLGGDEFVLLLPDTDEQGCDIVIERIDHFSKHVFDGRFAQLTLSTGKATKVGKTQMVDWIIQLADENMYVAKKLKRQRMSCAGD